MRVMLISANTITEPYPVYPLGLDYVAGAIADRHKVQIVDMNATGQNDSLAKSIREFSPDIIGLSLRNIDNTDTTDPKGFIEVYRKLIEVIRRQSNALIVLGGSGFTIFPAESLGVLNADYGVIGEGERLALLLDAIETGKDATVVPGIITRRNRTPLPAPWDKHLHRNFNANHSHLRFYLKSGGMLNLQTKRGCNFKCIYCTYPHIEGRHQRLIDPAEVADTALQLQATGAKYLFVTDSAFNSDYAHNIAVARAFKKAGVSIPWGAFFVPTKPPADYFRILADAGLTHVEFGTESLSDDVLASYRKPFRVPHVFHAHQAAIDAGLNVAHYFLLGGPGEDPATLKETLNRVQKLKKSVSFFFCGMRIYPYTQLYDIALKEGQISKNQSILAPVFYRPASIDTDEIIRQVKAQAQNRLNWVIGSGGSEAAGIIARLYERGHTGPLWEYLIH
ncbi:lipid biosynthesis B12-binding/radical SAM protein [Thermodesulfobacteriota bacterium]